MKVAMKQYGFWLTAWIVLGLLGGRVEGKIQLTEEARLVEYEKRNYTWPFEHYTPQTAGWKTLYDERLRQVEEMEGLGTRYEGFIQTLNSGLLVPNFTEHGFGLARCPDDLLAALQDGIRKGLPTATLEREVEVITGPRCKFINRPDLTDRVLQELRHYAETWAGIPLTPYRAYGFRVYQNDSRLFMHVDKMQTHIVSFILHIDSSEDAEPWPVFIEDLHGRTHEVTLTPGDMLFYESSKVFHGRPKRFDGSWYTSVFVHYYPTHDWQDVNHDLEVHYAVPPNWSAKPLPQTLPALQMVGTAMTEPQCEYEWCRAKDSLKWSGPGEQGYWIDPFQQKHPFHPKEVAWNEEL